MKKLLTIAVMSLSLSGFALASDRADYPKPEASMGQPFDGELLGRAGHPQPVPTVNEERMAQYDLNARGYNGHS